MKAPSMHLARIALLLLPLIAGCAATAPNAPVASKREGLATQAVTPQPAVGPSATAMAQPVPAATPEPAAPAAPALPAENKAAAPVAKTPAPAATRPSAPASPTLATKPASPAAVATPAPVASPTLDLNALKVQLKETKAIGVFTKLTLKNQVDDLLQQFRDYYQGKAKTTMAELRRSYDLLMMKVLSLLQDSDQKLASAIVSSREAIWGLLADPKKFATLEV